MPSPPKENHKDFFQHFFQIGANKKVTIGQTSSAVGATPNSFDPFAALGDSTRPLGGLMAILLLGSQGSLEKLVVVLVGGAEGLLSTENDLT